MSIISVFFHVLFFLSFALNGQPLLQILRSFYPSIRPSPTSHFFSDDRVLVEEGLTELITLPVAAATNFPLRSVDNSGYSSAKDELIFEAYSYMEASRSFSRSSIGSSLEMVGTVGC